MLKEKIQGHIIEQNKPPLKNAKIAIVPLVNKPISIAITPNKPNVFSVSAGLSFPIKNPTIWIATQIAMSEKILVLNPGYKFLNRNILSSTINQLDVTWQYGDFSGMSHLYLSTK